MNRRIWGFVALGALIILDVILVILALRPTQTLPTATLPPVDPVAESTQAGSGEGSEAARSGPAMQANLLLPATDGSLLMIAPGVCEGPDAEGWRLPPAASEWISWDLPNSVVSRFDVTGGRTVFAVASDLSCTEQQFYPAAGPDYSWGQGQPAAGAFYLQQNADSTAVIGTSEGQIPSPCPSATLALAATDTSSSVLCGDGGIYGSPDSGITWEPRGLVFEGRALAYGASNLLYALTPDPACNGLALASSPDDGTTWGIVSCIEGASSDGAVALVAEGNRVTVVDSDRTTYRSDNGGREFKRGA